MTGAIATRSVEPLSRPPDATIAVPGSKSLTNRAVVCALLGSGSSTLHNVLLSDDTEAMFGVARALGAVVEVDPANQRVRIEGIDGRPTPGPIQLDVRMSGTTARFSVPLAARGTGRYTVDGHPSMRARPMNVTADALREMGVQVEEDSLPITLTVAAETPWTGGEVDVPASASSQFASGLLLAAPGLSDGLRINLVGDIVSQSYLDLTVSVMESFGATIERSDRGYTVAPTPYVGTDYHVEPDASAASYFFAAAAVTGGRVRIDGLGAASLQGDVAFVRILESMGAEVSIGEDFIEVTGPAHLNGVTVDMSDCSDTAQTLAAIAPFASSPTRVTGVGFIRRKETDRISAVVTELTRLGVRAHEEPDGFMIEPSAAPSAARISTYDDHRMAMSFALVGLKVPGIEIADPGCVAKTFPDYFETLDRLY